MAGLVIMTSTHQTINIPQSTPDAAEAGGTPSLPVPPPVPPPVTPNKVMTALPVATEVGPASASASATVDTKKDSGTKDPSVVNSAVKYVFNRLVGARKELAPIEGATPAPVKDREIEVSLNPKS